MVKTQTRGKAVHDRRTTSPPSSALIVGHFPRWSSGFKVSAEVSPAGAPDQLRV
jgi:hypothetical protein